MNWTVSNAGRVIAQGDGAASIDSVLDRCAVPDRTVSYSIRCGAEWEVRSGSDFMQRVVNTLGSLPPPEKLLVHWFVDYAEVAKLAEYQEIDEAFGKIDVGVAGACYVTMHSGGKMTTCTDTGLEIELPWRESRLGPPTKTPRRSREWWIDAGAAPRRVWENLMGSMRCRSMVTFAPKLRLNTDSFGTVLVTIFDPDVIRRQSVVVPPDLVGGWCDVPRSA